jgi:hypothetical protein
MVDEVSQARQRLRGIRERVARIVGELLDVRGGLIRGVFGTRRRVCGKSGCRCTEGALHESKYLSAAVDGRTRQVHVPARDEVHVAEGVAAYHRWWEGRSELMKLHSEMMALLDTLGEALMEPYPPDAPIPPPKKRGRKPTASEDAER